MLVHAQKASRTIFWCNYYIILAMIEQVKNHRLGNKRITLHTYTVPEHKLKTIFCLKLQLSIYNYRSTTDQFDDPYRFALHTISYSGSIESSNSDSPFAEKLMSSLSSKSLSTFVLLPLLLFWKVLCSLLFSMLSSITFESFIGVDVLKRR